MSTRSKSAAKPQLRFDSTSLLFIHYCGSFTAECKAGNSFDTLSETKNHDKPSTLFTYRSVERGALQLIIPFRIDPSSIISPASPLSVASSTMTKWFDLPAEVKQIILAMVSDADSIIYVPRDRRRKVDTRYLQAHHFHDLLLVSKNFINSDEFAFAVLNSAKLKFYSYNELRRLTTEVSPSFKESIRRIHLSRTHDRYQYGTDSDTFKNFSTIENILSTEMPNLRQIYISWPSYCAQVVCSLMPRQPLSKSKDAEYSSMIDHVLSERPRAEMPFGQIIRTNSLSHVAASFVGNRTTSMRHRYWTRPIPWIRRIVLHAENANIEVIFQIAICFSCHFPYIIGRSPSDGKNGNWVDSCWSTRRSTTSGPPLQTHIEGKMSTKDYMFRIEHGNWKYAFHQQLAYDLLHSLCTRGQQYWLDLVKDLTPTNVRGDDGF